MLEVTDLTKVYGRGDAVHVAIDRISLNVAGGQLISIVGPSGCGKSTLLRCVAGLMMPTAGRVALRGVPVQRVPDGLAVVFQDYGRSLYPWLTVRDNVALPLRRATRARAARRQAADASLAAVGLSGVGDKYPRQLSGGMQQRVAIARALAADPVLLLMDEPFGSVDAQAREDLEDLVLRVRRERDITILLVTHDIDESVYVGDRVIVLTAGPGVSAQTCRLACRSRGTRSPPRNYPSSFGCAPKCPGWSAAGVRPLFRWSPARERRSSPSSTAGWSWHIALLRPTPTARPTRHCAEPSPHASSAPNATSASLTAEGCVRTVVLTTETP